MRATFVLSTIVLALALGIIAAASESRLLTRALIIGFVPAMWGLAHLVERLTGRDLWHFSAPYPYRWMPDEDVPARLHVNTGREPVEGVRDPDDAPRLRLAA